MAENNDNKNGNDLLKPMLTFAGGVVVGALVAPYAKEALKKFAPVANSLLDEFTAKASGFAEKSADIFAEAKERVTSEELN